MFRAAGLRVAGLARPLAPARQMSGHSMEHAIGARRPPAPRPPVLSGATLSLGARAEATSQWKKYSYMFVPVVVVFGVVTMGKHFMHGHHDHDEVPFPYMKKRDKAMPWALKGGSKCDLFDYDCSAKERALKAGVEPAHH